jgi:hypothetical protein
MNNFHYPVLPLKAEVKYGALSRSRYEHHKRRNRSKIRSVLKRSSRHGYRHKIKDNIKKLQLHQLRGSLTPGRVGGGKYYGSGKLIFKYS